jgi:4-amino-4-deoxy-L-arabinose transferase-like glycosyltransferase
VIAFTTIALPWFAAMWMIHGTEYTNAARAFTLGRYFSTIGGHGGTVFFYIPVLLITFFPWVVWLPGALWRVFRAKWQGTGPAETSGFFLLFAAVWIVGGLIFFSISQTRMAHYIAPLYPASAILVAQAWARLFENEHFGKWTGIFFVALGTVLGICFLSAPEILEHIRYKFVKEIPQEQSLGVTLPLVVIGTVLLVGTAVSTMALFWRRVWTAFWACHGMMLSFVLALVFLLIPRADHLLLAPSRELAQEVGRSIGPQGAFIAYGTYRPSLVFYARHEVIRLDAGQDSEVDKIISSVPQTFILARRSSPEWTPSPSWGRLIAVNGPYLLIARP